MKVLLLCLLVLLCLSGPISAQQQRQANKEAPPPQEYSPKFKGILNEIARDKFYSFTNPLSDSEAEDLKRLLVQNDAFVFVPLKTLQPKNVKISIEPYQNEMPKIMVGHNFTATLVFTDAAGNPWTADTLTAVSEDAVVKTDNPDDHIITIHPVALAGQANLPVKLKGLQRPISFLIEVSNEEAYFTVDVQVNGMGDSSQSQSLRAVSQYSNSQVIEPKLSNDPNKELMLQRLTPPDFKVVRLFDEYRKQVDVRDFMAWESNGKLYVLTPFDAFVPDPVDITASSDGRYRLFEYPKLPFISVKKHSKIFSLRIE